MARLRLLFALFLMSLGTWWGALAISGYYEPRMPMRTAPTAASLGRSAFPNESQFIGLLSRERFVVVEAPAATPAKPKPVRVAAKTKPPAVDKRPQQAAAQLPWPLSLFGN
jgi:hypothetical protein